MKTQYNVAVLAGDGIGPEVMAEAIKVLEVVADKFQFGLTLTPALVGGAAIDATGEPLPADTVPTKRRHFIWLGGWAKMDRAGARQTT